MAGELRVPRRILGGSILEYALVALVLFIVNLVIFDFSLFKPGSLFTGGVGDATSGFSYVLTLAQGWDPTLGSSTMANYPFGDTLAKPMYITWLAVLVPLWLLTRFLAPFTALTLITMAGYVSTGIATYGLVRRLGSPWYVAFFGGYAAAFVPYHVYKSSDHLTNVFNVVVVLVIGFFVAVWRRPTWWRILGLGASVALACYTDGYYILIVGVTLVALVIASMAADLLRRQRWKRILQRLRPIVAAGLTALVLMIPIPLVLLTQGDDVAANLQAERKAILDEAAYYSAHPIDFLLPSEANPIARAVPALLERIQAAAIRSNVSERTVFLGWTVLALVVVAGVQLFLDARRRGGRADTRASHARDIMVVSLPLVAVWALGPVLSLGSLAVPMPFGALIKVTALWRVPARMVLAIQPIAVVAACMAWTRIVAPATAARRSSGTAGVPVKRGAIWRVGAALVLTSLLALEYCTPIYTPLFSDRVMPQAYRWVSQQDDIRAVMELPLGPHLITEGYYAYAQTLHHKPMVNTSLDATPKRVFDALVGGENPEAINFARSRGADTVILHSPVCGPESWGRLVFRESDALTLPGLHGDVCVYRLDPAPVPDDMYPSVVTGMGLLALDQHSGTYVSVVDTPVSIVLRVTDAAGSPYPVRRECRLEANFVDAIGAQSIEWTVTQGGKVIASGASLGALDLSASIVTDQDIVIDLHADGRVPVEGELRTFGFEITAPA